MANNQRNILKRTKCSRTGSKPCAVRVRVGLGVGALHKKPETPGPTFKRWWVWYPFVVGLVALLLTGHSPFLRLRVRCLY
jgi:hypothetical protein